MILLPLLLVILFATNAVASPPCHPAGSSGPVQAPVFVRNLSGQTSWYASPLIADLDGSTYQPAGGHIPAWPRYNALAGAGNDAERNGQGHSGFGCYGLNVGIGDIDDDRNLEILATYDNHHIQAFDHDGVAINSAT